MSSRKMKVIVDENGRAVVLARDEVDAWQGGVPDPYAESSTQQFPLGTKILDGDRVFRYAKADSSAPGIGIPTQGATRSHLDSDDDITIPTATTAVPMAVGDKAIHITGTTNLVVVKDYYKSGYIYTNNKSNGGGQCLRIKNHAAIVNGATCVIYTYDPLTIALTPGTDVVGLRKNPYDAVIACPATATGPVLGVPLIAPTASYYFWLQTGGLAPLLVNVTIALGTNVVTGTSAGEVDPAIAANSHTEQVIGWAAIAGVTDKHTLVYLTIDR